MGTMQHKYTREYFTGRLEDGTPAGYGAEGYYSYLEGNIREQDLTLLQRIDFVGKRVLEFGFGRGESIKYILDHGAQYYEGVDFAPAAHQLAVEYLQKHGVTIPNLHQEDALVFISNIANDVEKKNNKYDIVLMFDFMEHVERNELREIMMHVKCVMNENGVLAINTPAFPFDNDVISQGVNVENKDGADFMEETSGMHCNKYSLGSLHTFLTECGFYALSEAHFFALKENNPSPFLASFRDTWQTAKARGVSLLEYREDQIESPPDAPYITPPVHMFDEGSLLGLSLYLDDFYLQFFRNGTYDEELLLAIRSLPAKPKVIFDVGGFMGVSSLMFSRLLAPEGMVYCFEPNIVNIIRIQKNLSLNPAEAEHIALVPEALGKDDERVCMLMSVNIDAGHSSTSQMKAAHGTLPQRYLLSLNFFEQDVQAQRLDTFVANTGIVPDLIKLDIEGAEHYFLEGGFQTLREHKPVLLIELHSPFCALKCADLLEQLGYVSHVLHEEDDKRLMVCCVHSETKQAARFNDLYTARAKYEEMALRLCQYERVVANNKECLEEFTNKFGIVVNHALYQGEWFEKIWQKHTELQQKYVEMQKKYVEMQKKYVEMQKKYSDLQQKNSDLQQKYTQAQAELSSARHVLSHPLIQILLKIRQMFK